MPRPMPRPTTNADEPPEAATPSDPPTRGGRPRRRRVRPLPTSPPANVSYSFWLGTFIWRGSVLPRVLLDTIVFGVVSITIVLLLRYLESAFGIDLTVTAGPFEAAGAVLGLLLVLRVNAGYNRWWEARVLWGGIVNQSRNLAITGLTFGLGDARWRGEFAKYVASFPHVTRRSLRYQRTLPELERSLSTPAIEEIATAEHMPDEVSTRISELLREARAGGMDGFAYSRAEEQRGLLINHLGGCERIRATPLARSSAILVRQFIFLYLVTLPLAMLHSLDDAGIADMFRDSFDYELVLVPTFTVLIAYILLALDRIGMELQNPFDTRRIDFLPLDDLCTMIERNVFELLHREDHPDVVAPHPESVEAPPDALHPHPDDYESIDVS